MSKFIVTNAIDVTNFRKIFLKGNLANTGYQGGSAHIQLVSVDTGTVTTVGSISSTGDIDAEFDITQYTGNYKIQIYLYAHTVQGYTCRCTFVVQNMYFS